MVTAASRIPVAILTGFLGSGKTTLLNKALRNPASARTAVVINEFGEIGLDHVIATASDDTIMVLENGCLCCTVFGDLVATMNKLYHARAANEIPAFDQVIIETSGLADPATVVQAFLSDPTLAGLYQIATVVATVDAVNGQDTLTNHVESRRQVALADFLLVTKLDLHSAANVAETELRRRLRGLNPAARIARADDPLVDTSALLCTPGIASAGGISDAKSWLNAAAYGEGGCADSRDGDHDSDNHAGHLHALRDRDIASFCFIRDEPIPREALRLLLDGLQQNLGPRLLRVKGIIQVLEEPERPAVIQGAQQLLHTLSWLDRWPDDDHRSKFVFITQGLDRSDVEDMIAVLDRVARRTAAARARVAG